MNEKVAWHEGMLLRPQHFQQQERFVLDFVTQSVKNVAVYPWGLASIEIDRRCLVKGEFGIIRCAGILPDGTPFSIGTNEVTPLRLDPGLSNVRVFLNLPSNSRLELEGAARLSEVPGKSRCQAHAVEVTDEVGGAKKTLQLGRYCFHLSKETELEGCTGLPIGRVKQVVDKVVTLDEEAFIPPCLGIKHIAGLESRLVGELGRELERCIKEHAQWLQSTPTRGAKEIDALISLQAMNRFNLSLQRQSGEPDWHPYQLYSDLLTLATDLSTTRLNGRIPGKLPIYRHDDLEHSLPPLRNEAIRLLRLPLEPDVEEIPVIFQANESDGRSSWYTVEDEAFQKLKTLVAAGIRLYLTVKIAQDKRQIFANQCFIAEWTQIEEVREGGIAGIRLTPESVPLGVDDEGNPACFQLSQGGPMWREVEASPHGLVFHIKLGPMDQRDLRLWAVKRAQASRVEG